MAESLERLQSALPVTYQLERELGRGRFATGYSVDDRAAGRKAVLKVLRPEIVATLDGERFLEAIRSAASLEHPNILAVYDVGRAGDLIYFARPFVHGESLRDRLDREGQLPIEEALQIVREVADSMGFAHSHDVVHGDLRPENILIREGHAVVSDFGVEKAVLQAARADPQDLATVVDDSPYMSPERFAGDRKLDERGDVYSLGCVLFEMLAGEPPAPGAGEPGTVGPPDVTVHRPGVPAEIVTALERALAAKPEARFGSAGEFCDALRVARLTTGRFALLAPTRVFSSTTAATLVLLVVILVVALIMWL